MITTCPSAFKSLINKAELLGARTDYRIDQQQSRNGTISFSVDFVNYYFGNLFFTSIISTHKKIPLNLCLEREKKFPELYAEHNNLKDNQENLKKQELELKNSYERVNLIAICFVRLMK